MSFNTTNMPSDFITTIDSDDEEFPVQNGESSRGRNTPVLKAMQGKVAVDEDLNPEFQFDFDGLRNEGLDLWGGDQVKKSGKADNEVRTVSRGCIEERPSAC